MTGRIYRFLSAVLLLGTMCAHAIPVDRANKLLTDSLEIRLQEINNPDDSIAALYNIYDLSATVKARQNVLNRLYAVARTHGCDRVQADVLINLSRLFHDNDSVLKLIESELATLPESDHRKESELYVRMLRSENYINGEKAESQVRHLNELVQRFTNNPPDDAYKQAELLFALCTAMGKSTQGELLENYLNKLQSIVESLNLGSGLVRNLVYGRSAPIFTNNRLYNDAVNIDKRLLNIIDSLAIAYEAHGRPYRQLYTNRYYICRRLLINYRGLNAEEVEFFHDALNELAAVSPEVARTKQNGEVPEIFYHMARKEYAEALPILKRQIDNPQHKQIRMLLLIELVEAAQALGDIHTQLDAAMELNKIYSEKIDGRKNERYRELQILYDYNDLRKIIADKELSEKEHNLRMNRLLLIAIGAVCLVLVVMMILLWRQYRRIKHLAAEHVRTTETLRKERNELRTTQKELIAARDKACDSERIKTEFTNTMSHEVKAPLAAIQEYSRLIVDCIPGNRKQYLDRFAFIIEHNVRILNRLVSDVLDMASFEYGTMTVSKSVESIDNICKVALDSVFSNGKTSSEDVKLVYNSKGQPDITFVTDMVRVTQVLMNLLDNADKFTEKGTISLEYEVDETDGNIRFIVSDTGIGIPDNCEEVIFERYRKLSPLSRGLGLGLYISRNIAMLLKGDVRVDTDYHGGARFIFTLTKEDCTPE